MAGFVDSDTTKHIPKFGGNIWYINKGEGSDSNDGKTPCFAFETIGAGLSIMSNGDALNVKAGTYTETGLDLSNDFTEIWFEIGSTISPASGTALTISGESCSVTGLHKVIPSIGNIGVLVSGTTCYVESSRVIGGTVGLSVTGVGAVIKECGAAQQTEIAYNLVGGQTKLYDCSTLGTGSTVGYRINSGADTGVLSGCTSVGHATSGFYIDTGSKDWTLLNCSSGAGDGKWRDIDSANVWSNFSYDDEIYKTNTFTGVDTEYNIYKVTGVVRITNINAHVETIIANTSSDIKLELYSTGGTVALSNSVGAPDLDSLPVGSLIIKKGDSTDALDACSSATPCLVEYGTKDPEVAFIVTEDSDQDTYVRLKLTNALASGALHWHCHWEPLTEEGFLSPV